MKYYKTVVGKECVVVRVDIPVAREEVESIKAALKGEGRPYSDNAVKHFVRSCTEYNPGTYLDPDAAFDYEEGELRPTED